MINSIRDIFANQKIKFFVWFAVRHLKFEHIITSHDGGHQKLLGISFCYDEEYADKVESVSSFNHRKDLWVITKH